MIVEIKNINPFIDALESVMNQFGITGIKKGNLYNKESMHVDADITSFIGFVGDIRGNISYSMSKETGKKIVSAMMMGMPVDEMDEMARSAIGELSNMITGNASTIFSLSGIFVDITPPSIVFGQDIFFIISSVQTTAIDLDTPAGKIEINIAIE